MPPAGAVTELNIQIMNYEQVTDRIQYKQALRRRGLGSSLALTCQFLFSKENYIPVNFKVSLGAGSGVDLLLKPLYHRRPAALSQ